MFPVALGLGKGHPLDVDVSALKVIQCQRRDWIVRDRNLLTVYIYKRAKANLEMSHFKTVSQP